MNGFYQCTDGRLRRRCSHGCIRTWNCRAHSCKYHFGTFVASVHIRRFPWTHQSLDRLLIRGDYRTTRDTRLWNKSFKLIIISGSNYKSNNIFFITSSLLGAFFAIFTPTSTHGATANHSRLGLDHGVTALTVGVVHVTEFFAHINAFLC